MVEQSSVLLSPIYIMILPMPEVVIADTSCLIFFDQIGYLPLLQALYNELVITPEIVQEFRTQLPVWINIQAVSDQKYQALLELQIDRREASVLALARESPNALLILDDLKARKLATQLNLKYTGTLGCITKAKRLKLIPQVGPLIEALLKTNFRISKAIIQEVLRINHEL